MERLHYNTNESGSHKDWKMRSLKIERDGRAIGTLEVIDIAQPIKVSYLDIMTVALDHRGQGVGKQLLQEFMSTLESQGRIGLLLNVIGSEHPAKHMYASMGWHHVADHPDWLYYNADFAPEESGERLHSVITQIQKEYM